MNGATLISGASIYQGVPLGLGDCRYGGFQ